MIKARNASRSILVSLLWLGVMATCGPVQADPPQLGANYNYDGWTVTNGVIDSTPSCSAAGVTCKVLSQDDGFLQEKVILDNGQHYIRVLMTDPGATGDPTLTGASADLAFASETFTAFYTNAECTAAGINPQDCQGLAAKQVVRDLASDFESTAIVQRNFAKSFASTTDGQFNIDLDQVIDTVDPGTGLVFKSGFHYTQWTYWECDPSGNCNGSTPIGSALDLSEAVFTDPLDATKKEEFRQHVREGWKGRQSGGWFSSDPVVVTDSVTIGGRTINGATTGTPTTFSWSDTSGGWGGAVANDIKTTWVAANTVDGFVYQSFELTDGSTSVTTSDNELMLDMQGLTGTPLDPFDWTAPNFGPAPVF